MKALISQLETYLSYLSGIYDEDVGEVKEALITKWRKESLSEKNDDKEGEFDVEELDIISRCFD